MTTPKNERSTGIKNSTFISSITLNISINLQFSDITAILHKTPISTHAMATSIKNAKKANPFKLPLILYNTIAGVLWSIHLFNTIQFILKNDQGVTSFYKNTEGFLTITQSLAVIEIFNSLFKIVRSPLVTTAAQVSSRLLIVIGSFQLSTKPISSTIGYEYITLSLAWSITEVVRYFFYAFNLIDIQPKILLFLRYNMFPILYPMGVTSELIILYKTVQINDSQLLKFIYIGSMLAYIPGFPVLFSHMWVQRKKAMKEMFSTKKVE